MTLFSSSFVYALPETCSYSEVMDNQEIDKAQIAACPTQWLSRAISRFVKKQYWQNQPTQSFADLGEKISLVSFFNEDLFLNTLVKSNSNDPVFKNFIELDLQKGLGSRCGAMQQKRIDTEMAAAGLTLPKPIFQSCDEYQNLISQDEQRLQDKINSLYPKYFRVFSCRGPYLMRGDFGSIGLVLKDAVFQRATMTLSGNLTEGKQTSSIEYLRNAEYDELKAIYEAHVWGPLTFNDFHSVLVPKGQKEKIRAVLVSNHHDLLAENVIEYEIEALQGQRKFGSYEYDKKFSLTGHYFLDDDGICKNQM
ncbi:hypothetical protein [Shewanella surugensis]|uniref:Uncharacterized protein n=1 Tax=Shewanella surugensis TaxID=212020 RepID=A0ABT0LCE7_9GAMM|nr:hypothetical protein [Shewanella surugensis]MCL1125362.1 hypothetical protein [Shewanella surugensis]